MGWNNCSPRAVTPAGRFSRRRLTHFQQCGNGKSWYGVCFKQKEVIPKWKSWKCKKEWSQKLLNMGVNISTQLQYKTVLVMCSLIREDSRSRVHSRVLVNLSGHKIQSPVSPSVLLRQRIEKGPHWYNRWTRTETWRGGRRDDVEGSGELRTCRAHMPACHLPISAACPGRAGLRVHE